MFNVRMRGCEDTGEIVSSEIVMQDMAGINSRGSMINSSGNDWFALRRNGLPAHAKCRGNEKILYGHFL